MRACMKIVMKGKEAKEVSKDREVWSSSYHKHVKRIEEENLRNGYITRQWEDLEAEVDYHDQINCVVSEGNAKSQRNCVACIKRLTKVQRLKLQT